MATNAAKIAELYGFGFLEGTDHVLIVKETPHHFVVIHQTMFNWRLATAYKSQRGFQQQWCYTGSPGFANALVQAMLWPDDDDGSHEPQFWYRNVQTDQRQPEYKFT